MGAQQQTHGLRDDTFIVIDAIKRARRLAHPATCALWQALEDAARSAVAAPGNTLPVRAHL